MIDYLPPLPIIYDHYYSIIILAVNTFDCSVTHAARGTMHNLGFTYQIYMILQNMFYGIYF